MACTLGLIFVLCFLIADGSKYHEHQESKEHGQEKNSNCHLGFDLCSLIFRCCYRSFAVMKPYMPNAIPVEILFLILFINH